MSQSGNFQAAVTAGVIDTLTGNTGGAIGPNGAFNIDIIGGTNISVAGTNKGNYKGTNPDGVGVMRGYGAATKGRKISGKMG